MKQYETTPDGNQLVMYAWGKGSENSLQAFPLYSVELWFYYCQYLAKWWGRSKLNPVYGYSSPNSVLLHFKRNSTKYKQNLSCCISIQTFVTKLLRTESSSLGLRGKQMLLKAATPESIFISGSLFNVLYAKLTGFGNPLPFTFFPWYKMDLWTWECLVYLGAKWTETAGTPLPSGIPLPSG